MAKHDSLVYQHLENIPLGCHERENICRAASRWESYPVRLR